MSGGLITGYSYLVAYIRGLISGVYVGGVIFGGLYLGDLYSGAHIRWLISRGMYPRANIWGLCPGGLNLGAGGGLNPGAYIRGAYIQ